MNAITANGLPANWAMDCGALPVDAIKKDAALMKLAVDCTPPGATRPMRVSDLTVPYQWHERAGALLLVAVVPVHPGEEQAAAVSAQRLAEGLT